MGVILTTETKLDDKLIPFGPTLDIFRMSIHGFKQMQQHNSTICNLSLPYLDVLRSKDQWLGSVGYNPHIPHL